MREPRLVTVVAAALVDTAGKVLVQRRTAGKAMAGLWEFPGGKVEPGEAPAAALVRDLGEELGITVDPADLDAAGFASVPHGRDQLILLLYRCGRWQGEPKPLDAAALQWRTIEDLRTLAMPPADRPLIDQLARVSSARS